MPIRGESVGTAYIRLIADGSGIPDDIRNSVEDATRSFHDPGSAAAKRFKQGWEEELAKHDDKSLSAAFEKALINDEAVGRFFNTPEWAHVEKNFRGKFGSLGQAAADDMKKEFLRKGNLTGIEDAIENVGQRVNNIFDDALRENEKFTNTAANNIRKFEEDFRKTMNETDNMFRESKKVSEDANNSLLNSLTRIRGALASTRSGLRGLRDTWRDTDNETEVARSKFSRLGVTIDHVAEGVGRAFGLGSRNNFLNFTGAFVQHSTELLGLLPKLIGNISEFATGFQEAAGEGVTFFQQISAGFTKMSADAEGGATALSELVSSGVLALPLLIVALAGVVLVLDTVASLISGIAAAIIALASSISFALVGAVAVLLPLIPVLGVGLAAAIAGFVGRTDEATKKLTEFKNIFKDLGKAVNEGFGETAGPALGSIFNKMRALEPLFKNIGRAFGDLATRFNNLFDKPGPNRLLQILQNFAPEAIQKLGRVVLNLTRAFSNIFIDAIPDSRNFLDWLIKITREFRKWVFDNGPQIQHFFDQAVDSAKTLGRFLGAAFKVLADLLFNQNGKKAGDNIIQSLTDTLNQFDDFLKKNPDALKNFFKHGDEVAHQIGQIALAFVHIFDALDSPEGQKSLSAVLQMLQEIGRIAPALVIISNATFNSVIILFNALSFLGGAGAKNVERTVSILQGVGNALEHIGHAIGEVGNFNVGQWIKDHLGSLFGGKGGGNGLVIPLTVKPPDLGWVGSVIHKISGIAPAVAGTGPLILSRFGVSFTGIISRAATLSGRVAALINSIPGRVTNLISGLAGVAARAATAMLQPFLSLPHQILSVFSGLGHLISEVIGTIHVNVDFPSPPSWLSKLANPLLSGIHTAAGGIFDGAQFRIIGEAGPEAVVPLTGPLDQVDPAVRTLAAIARGLGTNGGSTVGNGKTINNEWHITTPGTDAGAVAQELLNRQVATAY